MTIVVMVAILNRFGAEGKGATPPLTKMMVDLAPCLVRQVIKQSPKYEKKAWTKLGLYLKGLPKGCPQ